MPRPPVPKVGHRGLLRVCLLLAALIILVYGVLVLSALVESYPFNFTPTLKHFAYVGANFTVAAQQPGLRRRSRRWSARCSRSCWRTSSSARSGAGAAWSTSSRSRPPPCRASSSASATPTTFNQRWLDWLDRGALIMISMIFWNIPVGYRAAMAGLQQIDRSIDEAATSLGASSLRAFGDVLFPILRRAVHDRPRHRLRARDHDALGGHFPVHAGHLGGHDHASSSSSTTSTGAARRRSRSSVIARRSSCWSCLWTVSGRRVRPERDARMPDAARSPGAPDQALRQRSRARPSTTSRWTSRAAASRPCSGRPAAARRPRCAPSPASTSRTAATSSSAADASTTCPPIAARRRWSSRTTPSSRT